MTQPGGQIVPMRGMQMAQPTAAPTRSVKYSRLIRSPAVENILASARPAAKNGVNTTVQIKASLTTSTARTPGDVTRATS